MVDEDRSPYNLMAAVASERLAESSHANHCLTCDFSICKTLCRLRAQHPQPGSRFGRSWTLPNLREWVEPFQDRSSKGCFSWF